MEIPEMLYQTAYYTQEKRLSDAKNGDNFIIEDLLDIPNDAIDDVVDSTLPHEGSCNSSFSTAEPHYQVAAPTNFSGELCVPYDDVAELEWLSNIVEESFSSEDLQKLQLIQGLKARTSEASEIRQYQFQPDTTRSGPMFRPEVPGKARSKRSRAAPVNWTSRLQVVSSTPTPSASESDSTAGKKALKPGPAKKKEGADNSGCSEGRRCLHCATDKTPQWRTGPMGPKTLCNACGVRYKSGRLVPEYRPASSPTFVLAKHSNSHRKVLELRRQKEMQMAQQQHQFLQQHHSHQNMMFGVANSDDYLIHQHIGPDYRQLI